MGALDFLRLAVQLGSFGVLAYIIYWFTRKAFPQAMEIMRMIHKDFMAELRANRDHCDEHNRHLDRWRRHAKEHEDD